MKVSLNVCGFAKSQERLKVSRLDQEVKNKREVDCSDYIGEGIRISNHLFICTFKECRFTSVHSQF